MGTFYKKPGDNKFGIRYKLSDYVEGSGAFSGVSVKFQFMDLNGNTVENGDGTVLDDDGILGYAFSGAWADVVGTYRWEAKVTFTDGLIATYPSHGFEALEISHHVPDS